MIEYVDESKSTAVSLGTKWGVLRSSRVLDLVTCKRSLGAQTHEDINKF